MAEQMDQNIDQMITDKNLYLVFQLIGRKEYESAEAAIKLGIKTARDKCDANLEGLYYSAMGVLYKVQKDYKKAYKYYQQAEKLIKDDPAVSIISATLLIEQFKQYDTAAKKMKKVLEKTTDPALIHHALSLEAIALFCLGKKEEARESFEKILKQNFEDLRFAANLNYKAVELFVKKNFIKDVCQMYLTKALALAKSKKEKTYELIIENLLKLI